MPVTFVRDPATGVGYSVNIAGDTPTEQETARINEFLAAQSSLSPPMLPPAEPAPPRSKKGRRPLARGTGLERTRFWHMTQRGNAASTLPDQHGSPEHGGVLPAASAEHRGNR
jgi:hypothetical protein